jgi:hypothetical protein
VLEVALGGGLAEVGFGRLAGVGEQRLVHLAVRPTERRVQLLWASTSRDALSR